MWGWEIKWALFHILTGSSVFVASITWGHCVLKAKQVSQWYLAILDSLLIMLIPCRWTDWFGFSTALNTLIRSYNDRYFSQWRNTAYMSWLKTISKLPLTFSLLVWSGIEMGGEYTTHCATKSPLSTFIKYRIRLR